MPISHCIRRQCTLFSVDCQHFCKWPNDIRYLPTLLQTLHAVSHSVYTILLAMHSHTDSPVWILGLLVLGKILWWIWVLTFTGNVIKLHWNTYSSCSNVILHYLVPFPRNRQFQSACTQTLVTSTVLAILPYHDKRKFWTYFSKCIFCFKSSLNANIYMLKWKSGLVLSSKSTKIAVQILASLHFVHRNTQCVATELSARIYLPVHGLFT